MLIGKIDYEFEFRKLERQGHCVVCQKNIPRGTKVIRIKVDNKTSKKVSICPKCLEIMEKFSKGDISKDTCNKDD